MFSRGSKVRADRAHVTSSTGLRKQAARSLARVSTPDRADALRDALPHSDPEVKYNAAFGLACLGDGSVASLVFSEAAGKVLTVGDQIAAALGLGPAGEDRLIVFLDDPRDKVGSRALLLRIYPSGIRPG